MQTKSEWITYSDQQLLALVCENQIGALEILYDRHAPCLYPLISRIVRQPILAETVLEATFWQVWCAPNQSSNPDVPAYLYRLARTQSLAQLREQPATVHPVLARQTN
ncbi:MAG: hypothetical protein M3Q45_09615 [Chloroflexota bacterium]|nr:hypothetical protein [Chloroflexota bacterium]